MELGSLAYVFFQESIGRNNMIRGAADENIYGVATPSRLSLDLALNVVVGAVIWRLIRMSLQVCDCALLDRLRSPITQGSDRVQVHGLYREK